MSRTATETLRGLIGDLTRSSAGAEGERAGRQAVVRAVLIGTIGATARASWGDVPPLRSPSMPPRRWTLLPRHSDELRLS